MNNDVRYMLNQIDEFLNTKPRDTAEQLWDILTALRGPDDNSRETKLSTTAVVRAKAFPVTAISQVGFANKIPADFKKDDPERVALRIRLRAIPTHFSDHTRWAFSALGLDWDRVNQ